MDRQRGAGLLSSVFGLAVFLVLLLFCVQVMYHLYATSAVTGAAYDAARDVAGFDSQPDRVQAVGTAEARLRDRLGSYGRDRIDLQWDIGALDRVSVRVTADHPSAFPRWFSDTLPFTSIDRTIVVQFEDVQ